MNYEAILNEIKEKIDIVDYIGQFTSLQRKGNLHQGKCCLHNDKDTPSLTVYDETQSFYCFGCKAGGGVLDFVKDYYNYDFNEALEFLAEKAGVQLNHIDPSIYRKKKAKIQQNQRQLDTTKDKMVKTENTGKNYLLKRGFNQETINAFQLGYSDSNNTIVIPIHDGMGKVVGFSNRFLDEGVEPKYKNSRNDDVFNKGELLYNLYNARKELTDNLYVLEGYFDVMSLWQSGFKSAVGVMKDALTEQQAKIIAKLCKGRQYKASKTIVLIPDNDSTGIKSVEKNKKLLIEEEPTLDIRVAIPEYPHKDMNDILMAEGEAGIKELMEHTVAADYFILKHLLNDQNTVEKEYTVAKEYVSKNVFDMMVVEDLVSYLANRWGKSKNQVKEYLEISKGKERATKAPNNNFVEKQVIGILLDHPTKIDDVADILIPDFFYNPNNKYLYENILRQYQTTGEVSQTQLYLDLLKNNTLENINNLFRELTANAPPASELTRTVNILKDLYLKRKLFNAVEKIGDMVLENEEDGVDSVASQAQELIFQATDINTSTKTIFDVNELLANRLEEYVKRKEGLMPRGLQTGFMSLDSLTNGFKNKHLIILAAATSTGKTAFSLNIVRNVMKRKMPVAFVSLEMSAEEIMDRLIIQELRIDNQKYEQGNLGDKEFTEFAQNLNLLYDLPLRISDERGINVSQIRARLRRMKAQMGGLGLVVIDYLQTIQIPEGGNGTTARAVGDIVLQLRNLASELDTPIILLSQINRGYAQRQDKRPQVSDLRESGNIEEFADMIVFLYRHARTSLQAFEEMQAEGRENEVEIIVAKNRTGKTGTATLIFDDRYLRYIDPQGESLEKSAPR